MRTLLGLVVVLAACSSPGTAALDVTLTFGASLSDDAVARVSTLVIHASGDELASFPVTLGRPAHRTESFVYRPASDSHSLSIGVDAVDADGSLVAHGNGGPVVIPAHGAASLSIVLASPTDMPDQALLVDASAPADGASIFIPTFQNLAITSTSFTTSIAVAKPNGTESGTLLLAFVGGTNSGSSPVLLTAPSGWSTLTSVSSSSPTESTATWFWKIAGEAEPASYGFSESPAGALLGMVSAYSDVYIDQTGPFDGTPIAQANGASTMAPIPGFPVLGTRLIVVNMFAPDNLGATFSDPSGMSARQTAAALSADQLTASGQSPRTSMLDSSERTLELVVLLKSNE